MSKFLIAVLLAFSSLLLAIQVSAKSEYQSTTSAIEKERQKQNNDQIDNYSVTCTSVKKAPTHCVWDDHYGEPRIVQQLSRKKCVKGKNWAYHSNRDLWVTKGCSARFGSNRR